MSDRPLFSVWIYMINTSLTQSACQRTAAQAGLSLHFTTPKHGVNWIGDVIQIKLNRHAVVDLKHQRFCMYDELKVVKFMYAHECNGKFGLLMILFNFIFMVEWLCTIYL